MQLGVGLPGLPKKLVEKIEAEEFIDFGELPPAMAWKSMIGGEPLERALASILDKVSAGMLQHLSHFLLMM